MHTSLDADLQRAAEDAFDAGLRRIDKRRGFRKPPRNVIADDQTRRRLQARPLGTPDCRGRHRAGGRGRHQRRPGAPRAVAAGAILLRAGKYFVEVPKAGYAWTRKTSPDFVKAGDLVSVQVQSLDEATQFGTGQIEQDPAIEGALLGD